MQRLDGRLRELDRKTKSEIFKPTKNGVRYMYIYPNSHESFILFPAN